MSRMLILLALLGCHGGADKVETGGVDDDVDGDGFPSSEDCDDSDPDVNPDAVDACDNGVDDNCDGEDAACPCASVDGDGDGYPASDECGGIADCDDADATANPDEPEACDGVDNDCDGLVDENYDGEGLGEGGAPDETLNYSAWYLDGDEDSYGDAAVVVYACSAPTGYVADSSDCDDLDAEDHPGAEEVCDEVNDDDDCDGLSDDDDDSTTDYEVLYSDNDDDGYGGVLGYDTRYDLCDPPAEGYWSRNNEDCDDEDTLINPAATEICDPENTDEDCDAFADDADLSVDTAGMYDWYADVDGDGYVLPDVMVLACDEPDLYSTYVPETSADCDDAVLAVHPDALDYCDGIDDDCDGVIDEDDSVGAPTWYRDLDSDGYGDPDSTAVSCAAPVGYVSDASDCDDSDSDRHPNQDENCDSIDWDCDGDATAGAVDKTTYYLDHDRDGYGWAGDTMDACTKPGDYVENATDCDDNAPSYNEWETYYYDRDGDAYGEDATTKLFCGPATGRWVAYGGDCNESQTRINPGAAEICNSIDDDCDGDTDDADTFVAPDSLTLWYEDADGDGYGSEVSGYSYKCTAPAGYIANGEDCDDGDTGINPAAAETCNDIDDDCDGDTDEDLSTTTWSTDNDGDGYGDVSGAVADCNAPYSGWIEGTDDCDDGDISVHPGAAEKCDGIDSDCSGAEDPCMSVNTTAIALEPSVGGTFTVDYPVAADDTLAFIAVGKLIEHGDDQCDYETTITDEGGYYSFTIDLEHCGYGHFDSLYGFEASAVVLGSVGGGASFSSFDLAVHGGGTDTDALVLSSEDAAEGVQLCAVYSADGEGDNDAEWSCEAGLSGDSLTGELYSGYGDGDNWAGARFMNIVPGDNVEATVEDFTCNVDGTASVSHTISSAKGDDHQAYVALRALRTSEGKHMSFESKCTLTDDTYTCDMVCYGSGSRFLGSVLFLDGDF